MADEVWVVRHGQRQDSVDPDWDERADRVEAPLCGLTCLVREGDTWQLARSGDTAHLDE